MRRLRNDYLNGDKHKQQLLSLKKFCVLYHIIFYYCMCSKCSPSARMQAVDVNWRDSPTARSKASDPELLTRCWCAISVRRLKIIKGIQLVLSMSQIVNDLCLSDFLSRCMRSPVWIHCCKLPDYDFCVSQGSVETVIKWGKLNYGHLR